MARYRYFLGLALPDGAGRRVEGLRQSFGWDRRIVDRDRLHMTVAVIDLSCDRRRPEYGQGVEQALAGVELPAVSVRFDRRDRGMLVYSDRLAGFHGLQQTVIAALLRHRIAVDHAPRRPHLALLRPQRFGAGQDRADRMAGGGNAVDRKPSGSIAASRPVPVAAGRGCGAGAGSTVAAVRGALAPLPPTGL